MSDKFIIRNFCDGPIDLGFIILNPGDTKRISKKQFNSRKVKYYLQRNFIKVLNFAKESWVHKDVS